MTEDIRRDLEKLEVPVLWKWYYEGILTEKARDYLLRIEYEQLKCELGMGSYESMRKLAEDRHLGLENVKRIIYKTSL